MKKSMVFKVTAFILCTVTLIMTALSVFAAAGFIAFGFYERPLNDIRKKALSQTIYDYSHEAATKYHFYSEEDREEYFLKHNLYFEIYNRDDNSNPVASSYNGEDYEFKLIRDMCIEEYFYEDNREFSDTDTTTADETLTYPEPDVVTDDVYSGALSYDTAVPGYPYYEQIGPNERIVYYEYTVVSYLPTEYFTTDAISFIDYWIKTLYSLKDSIYIIGGVNAIAFVIFLVMLCCSAGWKKGEERPRTALFGRIPFDVFTAVYAVASVLGVSLFFNNYHVDEFDMIILSVLVIIIGAPLLISYIYSFAARAKTGELFTNTVIWFIIKSVLRVVRYLFRGVSKVLVNLPAFWKTLVLLIAGAVMSFIIIALTHASAIEFAIFLWLVCGTIISILALYITYGYDKLRKGSERIARGEVGHRIDSTYMIPSQKKFAETINNIGGGISFALDERVKSERFKTELITNVSHDLKTPLTSIVNYVDLLKNERAQEKADEAKIDEYIEVLERQSGRLRKLTEDLVEASKASTGNLDVMPTPIDLGEMVSQTEGEYAEKLLTLGLELIVRRPEIPLTIMADGKHLSRIFDNLMNNIEKYALPGTRVYIDACEHAGSAYVVFRNTSRYELKISGEELTERFVRGDSSRHTEGSGLGLSIARSLAELSGGRLDIYIDGDLFKVVLGFDVIK
ncbi:MAG: HAMP domain-containing histidine kinase [Ruminococcaceae bacterium]|nr:HAMP domain-containing histidine kinase [Oscillospiraceae bacterium]